MRVAEKTAVAEETSEQAKQDRYILWKAAQRLGPGVLLWRGNASAEEWAADMRERIRRDRRSQKEASAANLRNYRAYYGLDPVTGTRPDAGWATASFLFFFLLFGGYILVALL